MDAFGDNNFDQPEVDPAAEFLAREQDALAGLEDEVQPAAAAAASAIPPAMNHTNNDNIGLESSGSFEMINNIGDQPDTTMSSEPEGANYYDREDDGIFDSGLGHTSTVSREEPEKIRKWREEQKTRLEEKDKEEEKKKEELREQAKKELEDWYKHHEETIAKTKASNRESAKNAEKQFVAENDEIEPGTEWERIAKLCDFNPKSNKSSRDVSRMRSIILQLKQSPIQSSKKA